ncbi:uncharacterized protein [Watersipora subatra]|uniref:uncharacterized protein n=1 Tax=Watersipora subatra TaxID=2589382 RepID=UPI00355C88B9
MLTSIRGLLFGVSVSSASHEEYVGAGEDAIANTLCTTAADDGWLLVDDDSPSQTILPDPMENLFIEHPSMSVYGALPPKTISILQPESSENAAESVVSQSSNMKVRLPARRSECYNLRKLSMQNASKSKKQTTRRAFKQLNQTSHYPKSARLHAPRSFVFQPRK